MARLGREQRQAIDRVASLLQAHGHELFEQSVDYGGVMRNMTVRYANGAVKDAAMLEHPDQMERRTKRLIRIARTIPARSVAAARAREGRIAGRINRVFDKADIVLTPIAAGPAPLLTKVDHTGLVRSWLASNAGAWAMPWNVIGQPALTVPAGRDTNNLPLAVQLCGRPGDNSTILRVGDQLEAAQPRIDDRPAL
jgi:amidase